jgi:hypothetical protein
MNPPKIYIAKHIARLTSVIHGTSSSVIHGKRGRREEEEEEEIFAIHIRDVIVRSIQCWLINMTARCYRIVKLRMSHSVWHARLAIAHA